MKIDNEFVIDTNIIVYSLDRNSKFYKFSKSLIEDTKEVFITSKSISEFVSVFSKLNLYHIIDKELINIVNNFTILYPNNKSTHIFTELVKKYKPVGNRVFDIEIVSIMKSRGINKIATVNYKDFDNISDIEIITI